MCAPGPIGIRAIVGAVVLAVTATGCGAVARDVARRTEILTVDTLKRVSELKKAQTQFEERIQASLDPRAELGPTLATKRLLDSNRHQALAVAGAIGGAPVGTLLARLHAELVTSVVSAGDRDAALLVASFQQPAEARSRWAELEASEQQLATLRKKLKELAAPESLDGYVTQIRELLKELQTKEEAKNGKAQEK